MFLEIEPSVFSIYSVLVHTIKYNDAEHIHVFMHIISMIYTYNHYEPFKTDLSWTYSRRPDIHKSAKNLSVILKVSFSIDGKGFKSVTIFRESGQVLKYF